MRATLEQLKAMSNAELYKHWSGGSFPFELASCGTCLTQHTLTGFNPCMAKAKGDHDEFTRQIKAIIGDDARIVEVREKLEEIYALRLFHAAFYQHTPEAAEEKTITESAPSLVAQG